VGRVKGFAGFSAKVVVLDSIVAIFLLLQSRCLFVITHRCGSFNQEVEGGKEGAGNLFFI
jgi:hypothetical protein